VKKGKPFFAMKEKEGKEGKKHEAAEMKKGGKKGGKKGAC
jgi:hypothetical protein